MNEISLVKHIIKLYKIAQECGILQLEDYNENTNRWKKNKLYSYCLQSVLNGIDFSKIARYLELDRNRYELIIIKWFEFISSLNYSVNEVTTMLGAMLKYPLLNSSLKDSTGDLNDNYNWWDQERNWTIP